MSGGERAEKRGFHWWAAGCLDEVSLYSPKAWIALCYPRASGGCTARVSLLEQLGVSKMCSMGPTTLPELGLRVLGKGHASVVVAGVMGGSLVAIKSRRVDSKRESLLAEAHLLWEAWRAGVAPRPLYYNSDIIVMEAVTGPRLEDLLAQPPVEPWVFLEALRAARALDTAGILHLELSRPWRNVLYTGAYRGSKAVIVDYESARRGCGNVLSLLGGLARTPKLKALASSKTLREYMRRYRETCDPQSYSSIEELVEEALGGP